MAARLGRVLYWGASGAAALCALWALFALYTALTGGSTEPVATEVYALKFIGAAIAFWVLGRAARYVLAAE